jgi:hypothetical protein
VDRADVALSYGLGWIIVDGTLWLVIKAVQWVFTPTIQSAHIDQDTAVQKSRLQALTDKLDKEL